MCMSLGCLKFFIRNSSKVMSLIGLLVLAFGVYVIYQTTSGDYKNLYFDDADWLKNLQEYGVVGLGLAILLISLCGVYGAGTKRSKRRPCLLLFYQVGALILTLTFLILAGFTLVWSVDMFGEKCEDGTDWSQQVNEATTQASLVFCTDACKCYIDPNNFDNKDALFGLKYDQSDDAKHQIQKCEFFDEKQYGVAATFMGAAEEIFKCSGWCKTNRVYTFSDSNRGNPEDQSCFTQVGDFISSKGRILGYVFLGLGILFGLNVLLTICLCCNSEQKQKKQGYYQRMVYYDEE